MTETDYLVTEVNPEVNSMHQSLGISDSRRDALVEELSTMRSSHKSITGMMATASKVYSPNEFALFCFFCGVAAADTQRVTSPLEELVEFLEKVEKES